MLSKGVCIFVYPHLCLGKMCEGYLKTVSEPLDGRWGWSVESHGEFGWLSVGDSDWFQVLGESRRQRVLSLQCKIKKCSSVVARWCLSPLFWIPRITTQLRCFLIRNRIHITFALLSGVGVLFSAYYKTGSLINFGSKSPSSRNNLDGSLIYFC